MNRTLKTVTVVWVLALLALAAVPSSSSETAKNSLADVLKLFPGYHVVTLNECDPGMRSSLSQNYPKANPSVVHADFDGDGSPDYALLLKNDATRVTKFVILLCPVAQSCKKVNDIDESQMSGIVYLRPVAHGTKVSETDAVDTGAPAKRVTLRATAVELNYFGKASVVLYWDGAQKKIEEIATAD